MQSLVNIVDKVEQTRLNPINALLHIDLRPGQAVKIGNAPV